VSNFAVHSKLRCPQLYITSGLLSLGVNLEAMYHLESWQDARNDEGWAGPSKVNASIAYVNNTTQNKLGNVRIM
jgi:hypothetical protein